MNAQACGMHYHRLSSVSSGTSRGRPSLWVMSASLTKKEYTQDRAESMAHVDVVAGPRHISPFTR